MARPPSRYVCQACGTSHLRWEGQCRGCGAWDTLVETIVRGSSERRQRHPPSSEPATPRPLSELETSEPDRRPTGLPELDRVLGGGLVRGSIVLLGGEPGIGKSTLVLEAAAGLAERDGPVLYVSGEESAGQLRLRAARLGLTDRPAAEAVHVLAETDVERIIEATRRMAPSMVVVDSVQTLHSGELSSAPGSVAQVREAANALMEVGKRNGTALVLVGHVTKEGAVAGPRVLEHLVDCVLLFIPNEAVYAFIQEQDRSIFDDALRDKVVFCSPLTLFAVLAVIRQAVDNFRLSQTTQEILARLQGFEKQWVKFVEQMDKVGRSLKSAGNAFDELEGTRKRGLERGLDKIDALRRQQHLDELEPDADGTVTRLAIEA